MLQAALPEFERLLGQRQPNVTMSRVGYVITIWSYIESAIVSIVARLLDADHNKVGVLMYHNMSFGGWIAIVTDLLATETALETQKRSWNSLVSELRRIKDLRDRVAHHPVTIEGEISPAHFDLRAKSIKQKVLGVQELDAVLADAETLCYKLAKLALEITQAHSEEKRRQKALSETDDLGQPEGQSPNGQEPSGPPRSSPP
jgi:hypothetical protein